MKSLFNEFEDRFGFSNNFLDSNVFSICLEDEQNRVNNIAPDTFGADKFFIESFITCEMADDFWIISNDFLNHHFPRIKEFNDIAVYNNDFSGVYTPSTALQNRILSIMYNAAKTGDAYSVELIKTLYKTYHKAEYKQLKRFKTISVPEIFALGQIYDDDCEYDNIPYSVIECEKHRELNRRMAQESIVLLKNNGILPLSKCDPSSPGTPQKIAVIGR